MSKGSKVVVVRIPAELGTEIDDAIHAANAVTREEPYNRSTWVRKCITDRLKHLARGRGQRNGSNEIKTEG